MKENLVRMSAAQPLVCDDSCSIILRGIKFRVTVLCNPLVYAATTMQQTLPDAAHSLQSRRAFNLPPDNASHGATHFPIRHSTRNTTQRATLQRATASVATEAWRVPPRPNVKRRRKGCRHCSFCRMPVRLTQLKCCYCRQYSLSRWHIFAGVLMGLCALFLPLFFI